MHRRRADAARRLPDHAIWSRSRRPSEAPSDLAIIGRYILTPDIFDDARGDRAAIGTGEIQLTNGLKRLLEDAPALRVRSHRRPPRHRQQARIPEGRRVLRAAAAGSGRAVPGLPEDADAG